MIAVIGGGPIGSYTAYLLAKGGKEVTLYEACSSIDCHPKGPSIVTNDLDNFHALAKKKQKFVLNEYESVRIHAPNGEKLEVPLKLYLIDRGRLTKAIQEMAEKEKVRIHFSQKFIRKEEGGMRIMDLAKKGTHEEKTVKAKMVIGADGPHSAVAKSLNPRYDPEKKGNRIQSFIATVSVKRNPKVYEIYLGSRNRNFFAWVAPENEERVKVGILGTEIGEELLQDFLRQQGINKEQVMQTDAGVLPIFNTNLHISNASKERDKADVYIVGEAATQTQTSTGSSLMPGLRASSLLAEAILQGKEYEKLVRRYINPDLLRHKMMRKMMNVMSEKDYDYLIKLLKQKRMVKKLSSYKTTELSKLFFSLLLLEPRLLYFSKMLPALSREGR